MELKISKRELLRGLEKTLTIVERRNTMPSLNHALFDVKDSELLISATDLEIFLSSQTQCKTLDPGRIALPARSMFDIVKECQDDGDIYIKSEDGTKAVIKSGKSQFRLNGLPADTFPHFKASPKGQLSTAKLRTKDFIKLIQKTEYAVSTEEIRYFLTGIYFESVHQNSENYLRMVATDGTRLSLMESPANEIGNLQIKKGLIIPKKGASELRKLLEASSENEFELSCDENLIRATVGHHQLWIRPIDGEYPDYKRVIPAQLPAVLKVSKKDIVNSLRRMSLLVSERSRVVTFEFLKDKVLLSTVNPDLGEANDEIECEYTGNPMKTGFNVRFFLEALGYIHSEELEIGLGEKLQPALLKSSDEPGFLSVVMPMRI